jgi:hypothetical protein
MGSGLLRDGRRPSAEIDRRSGFRLRSRAGIRRARWAPGGRRVDLARGQDIVRGVKEIRTRGERHGTHGGDGARDRSFTGRGLHLKNSRRP